MANPSTLQLIYLIGSLAIAAACLYGMYDAVKRSHFATAFGLFLVAGGLLTNAARIAAVDDASWKVARAEQSQPKP